MKSPVHYFSVSFCLYYYQGRNYRGGFECCIHRPYKYNVYDYIPALGYVILDEGSHRLKISYRFGNSQKSHREISGEYRGVGTLEFFYPLKIAETAKDEWPISIS